MTVDRNLVLGKRQRLAFGDANLLAHQILADDLFGDRMLNLQARINF